VSDDAVRPRRARGGIRRVTWALLHTELGRFTWGQGVVVFLIALSFVLLALETEPALPTQLRVIARQMDVVIPWLFAIEFALRVWASGASPLYRGARGRVKFFRRPLTWLDFLAFAPEIVVQLLVPGGVLAAGWIRLLRLFRLLKLFAMFRAFREIGGALHDAANQLAATFAAALMLLFVSATVLFVIEGSTQPEAFGSIPRALWWAVATLTTVGYGDVYPLTPLGKVVAGGVAVLGVGTVALPAGILANTFAERLRRRRRPSAQNGRMLRRRE
jgi:voltage-gated potassium channel